MKLGWQLLQEHPLTGVGIGGYPILFRGIGAWPHNVVLELGAEMGICSALIFCILVWLSFRQALRLLSRINPQDISLSATVFAFFVLEFLNMMNTGSINDNRAMWLALGLPFVLKNLRVQEKAPRLQPIAKDIAFPRTLDVISAS